MEKRTKDNPWKLKTPPQTSEYQMYVDEKDGKEIIVCTVGTTVLHYDYRCLKDLHAMLKKHGDWMELGSKDEKQEAVEGTVEYWARSSHKSHWWLVRSQERLQGPLRHVHPTSHGSAGACRGGT